jgi:hypothetical protein
MLLAAKKDMLHLDALTICDLNNELCMMCYVLSFFRVVYNYTQTYYFNY